MPTRRLDNNNKMCNHQEHKPKRALLYKHGEYEHICPKCGKKKIFKFPVVQWK